MQFFDIENIAIHVLGYDTSYVELLGIVFGLISVFYASRANVLTWSAGILNEFFLFILFFQVQLYADMFLQIFFFIVTIYGWYNWTSNPIENKISVTGYKSRWNLLLIISLGTLICGYLISNIHITLPQYFKIEASYPFTDSFIMVTSIIATVLLAKRKVETWYLWIVVDIVCIILYYIKSVYFLSFEYIVFLGLAVYGLYYWKKQIRYE